MQSAAADKGAGDRRSIWNVMSGATGPLIGLILLCLFLSVATDKFLSLRNFLNISTRSPCWGSSPWA